MTRDEFVKALGEALKTEELPNVVDVYVRAGMLKLDEPPSIKSRFRRAVSPIGQGVVGEWSENIWECIHLSGLRIVEK